MQREDLAKSFSLEAYKVLVSRLVKTELYVESRNISHSSSTISAAVNIGHFLDNRFNNVLVITHNASLSARIKLATDTFKLMADNNIDKALVAYVSTGDELEWRFSYISISIDEFKGKIKRSLSNPRRYSYVLGPNSKNLTPFKHLIQKGQANDIAELQQRFSLEVVNNEFYKEIARLYDLLVGTEKIERKLKYSGSSEESHEFAVRLIGRIIFCWFLREKKSAAGIPLIPSDILSRDASSQTNYYRETLAPLFFEVLNKTIDNRVEKFKANGFKKIPYLNGGLFSDDEIDKYKFDTELQMTNIGPVYADVPDDWLHELFDLLERFNFTVDENTSFDTDLSIDPEMLGRVFENLLARINPETGETVRKSTGSFYTPREIVDYMVDSSLVEYLVNKTGVSRVKLNALLSYELLDDNGNELSEPEGQEVLGALSSLTVLDPACGSGAYPIGMLQKIVYVISILDPEAKWWLAKQLEGASPELKREFQNKGVDYVRKLGIIRQTIFGVDIQPIATEISRLRCFLTLIVDENIDDSREDRGIKPLPNLDFKFVTANTLIKLPITQEIGHKDFGLSQEGFFEDESGIAELSEVMADYFSAPSSERDSLKYKYTKQRAKISEKLFTNIKDVSVASKTYKLSTWDPFEHKPSEWFDPKWMFGIDKFDIVIANPPYIQIQKFKGQAVQKILEEQKYDTYTRTGDIYCLFYEMGIKYTKVNTGLLCYITSNKWLRSNYGRPLREFMANLNPITLIDLGSGVFESAAVDTNIIVLQNTSNLKKTATATLNAVSDLTSGEYVDTELDSGEPWVMSTEQDKAIKSKLNLYGKQLKKLGITINKGLMTGYNKAFYIDKLTRDGLIAEDPSSEELIYKNLRGREISEYYTKPTEDSYVMVTSNYININNYPAIEKHLLQFEDKLKARAQYIRGDHEWFTVDNCPSKTNLEKYRYPKIIYPNMTQNICFAVDESGSFSNDKTFTLVANDIDIYYLAGILNSKLIRYYLRLSLPKLGDKGYEVRKVFFENTPIIIGSPTQQSHIQNLVHEIIKNRIADPSADTTDLESHIDQLVYELYDLTPEEIAIVEGSK